MSNHYYAPGSQHNDHHKELTVNGPVTGEQLARLMDGFFADKADNVSFEEEPSESLALSNIIFNTRIFTTEAHFEQLREAVAAFVDQDSNGEKYRLDATVQAEWYYVLKGIDAAQVASPSLLSDTNFMRQMLAWFPALFAAKEGEDTNRIVRRYASSLSAERKKWITGIDAQEVNIRDMFAFANSHNMEKAKVNRFHGMAEGLRKRLAAVKEEAAR